MLQRDLLMEDLALKQIGKHCPKELLLILNRRDSEVQLLKVLPKFFPVRAS